MSHRVIKNVNQAVALHYDGKTAPKVTAKGFGEVADQIIRVAEEHDVPIKEQPELVHFLSKVELGHEIPETLYLAAAEVIAFAYMLKHKTIADVIKSPEQDQT